MFALRKHSLPKTGLARFLLTASRPLAAQYPLVTVDPRHGWRGHGWPIMWVATANKPSWQPHLEDENDVLPRDEFGVPASIPPEVSSQIKHVYFVPPQFYPFLKKLGDDSPELKQYTDKLIKGEFTHEHLEEMFYSFAKPLRVRRSLIPMPYRTKEEQRKSDQVAWESAWYSYRQRVANELFTIYYIRHWIVNFTVAWFASYMWFQTAKQWRIDMKLFYIEAPEHKINWVQPRLDR